MTEHSIKVLYFASFAEKLQCREEICSIIELHASKQAKESKEMTESTEMTVVVDDLKHYLRSRGHEWQEIFSRPSSVLAAVNLVRVKDDFVLSMGDEVAFFPPVTGG
jgi:molybdopterin synthase sulfur carrier subunit